MPLTSFDLLDTGFRLHTVHDDRFKLLQPLVCNPNCDCLEYRAKYPHLRYCLQGNADSIEVRGCRAVIDVVPNTTLKPNLGLKRLADYMQHAAIEAGELLQGLETESESPNNENQ